MKWKVGVMTGCVAALLAVAANAQEPASWRVLIEPKFMKAPVVAPIAGAKRTELAAGSVADGETTVLTKEQFEGLGVNWEAFTARSQTNAAADVAGVKLEPVRDRKKIITYIAVRPTSGSIASAVLAPGFLDLFKDTLGDKVLVIIPNRSIAYVFPALASSHQEYGPLIFGAYRATPYPVSTEVFELSKNGLRAVGAYKEP